MIAKLITDLGDAAFLLPASAVVAAHLLLAKSKWAAVAWVSTVALCAALTLWTKLAYFACGQQFPGLTIHSPSGHASLSTTFYLCGSLMLSFKRERYVQLALVGAGALLVLAIAASRVWLHAHTPPEAALGMAIGLICVAWFLILYRRSAREALPWGWLLAVTVALAVATHGNHVGVENRLADLAARLRLAGLGYVAICPPDKQWAIAREVAAEPASTAAGSN